MIWPMKRLLALVVVAGFGLAQVPAYSENTFGVGYGVGSGFMLQGSALLPFSPLGIDTALEVEVAVPTAFDGASGWALIKANLLPAVTVGDFSMSVGVGLDVSYSSLTSLFGTHLGSLATLEIPGGSISGYAGLGYKGGFNVAYGFGGRLYLDPLAFDIGLSDRYTFKAAVLYLY
jgi:hypothetical protein